MSWRLGWGTFDDPPNPDRTLYAEIYGGGAWVVVYARDLVRGGNARRVVARVTSEESARAASRLLGGGA